MTKSELIEAVAEEANLTKGRAELVINTIFDSMVETLQRGEGIEIRGFGSFSVRQYKAYDGRNPRTGDTVHVAPKRLPFFKVGKELRERVNGTWGEGDGESSPPSSSSGGGTQKPAAQSSNTRPAPAPPSDPDPRSEDVI